MKLNDKILKDALLDAAAEDFADILEGNITDIAFSEETAAADGETADDVTDIVETDPAAAAPALHGSAPDIRRSVPGWRSSYP